MDPKSTAKSPLPWCFVTLNKAPLTYGKNDEQ